MSTAGPPRPNKKVLAQQIMAALLKLSPTAPWSRSGTSQQAAAWVGEFINKRRFRVWEIIFDHGPVADHEITAIDTPHNKERSTITPRRNELERAGMVRPSGQYVKTPKNQQAMQWVIEPNLDMDRLEAAAVGHEYIDIGEIESRGDVVMLRVPKRYGWHKNIYIADDIFSELLHLLGNCETDNESITQLFEHLWSWGHREDMKP